MLYMVIGRFKYQGKPWAETVNTNGIREAAQLARERKIPLPDALPPGSYRDLEVERVARFDNIELIAVIPGNHVIRFAPDAEPPW